jgi:ribosomal protein S18 acetylase RimI-like enzyme
MLLQASSVRILPVREEDIPDLVRLARDIWYQHYPNIITVQQIEYMLAQGYSQAAIRAQIAGGEAWWDKLLLDGKMVAFCACVRGESADALKVDKLYVSYELRGRGYGSLLLDHARKRARDLGCKRIYLQVNKNNRSAIEAYLSNGFAVAESVTVDIGGGFVMDDYVMEKEIVRREA